MPIHDDKDIRRDLSDDDRCTDHDHDDAEHPAANQASEIAMRLSVLGKLIIPPAINR